MRELEGCSVLVTGATGMIGSHLVATLAGQGANVTAMGRSAQKLDQVFGDDCRGGHVELFEHDILQPIPRLTRPVDFVFHAASPIAGSIIKTKPMSVIDSNIRGTLNCLDYLKEQREVGGETGRLVVFSSATVYSGALDSDKTVTEEDTCRAEALDGSNAAYSESKRMVEVIARSYCKQYAVDVAIARIGYVYGFAPIQPQTAFFEFAGKALSGEDIVIATSGLPRRDNIYVEDAVSGLLTVALKGEQAQAYNVSTAGDKGGFVAPDEMAQVMAEHAGKYYGSGSKVVYANGQPASRQSGLMLDNSKLKGLGWSVQHSLEEGIGLTLDMLAQDRSV